MDHNGILEYSRNANITTKPEKKQEEDILKAEVPPHCSNDVNHIYSTEDIEKLYGCRVVKGDIEVKDFADPILQFGNIEHILGSLIIENNPRIVRIESEYLKTIEDNFRLKELTSLAIVSLPQLESVEYIDWKILPILTTIDFSKDLHLRSIRISDTSLGKFSGFKLTELQDLDINNNRELLEIDCCVAKISGKLHIAANSRDVKVSLPKLTVAKNISIHDVAEIDLSNLEKISASANIINNHFGSFKLPNLKVIGGTLSLLKNEELSEIEFSNLTEIEGGLMIIKNSKIDKINFFPKLLVIGGAIEIVGDVKEISFKSLRLVKGSAKIKSTSTEFDCSKWYRNGISTMIRGGKVECINAKNEKVISDSSADKKDDEDSKSSTTNDIKPTSGAPKFLLALENLYYVLFFYSCLFV